MHGAHTIYNGPIITFALITFCKPGLLSGNGVLPSMYITIVSTINGLGVGWGGGTHCGSEIFQHETTLHVTVQPLAMMISIFRMVGVHCTQQAAMDILR